MLTPKSDHALRFQAWALYRWRFCISADAIGDWDAFLRLIAQITYFGAIRNLSISERVGLAIRYCGFLNAQLESTARGRAKDVDYFRLLSEEQIDTRRRFAHPITSADRNTSLHLEGKNVPRAPFGGS